MPNAVAVQFLQAPIDPAHVGWLSGLACRNLDRIVHLDISVNWPPDTLAVEKGDFQRLIFWNSSAEYLFPKGSFVLQHGSYIVKGYFIPRSGGIHQGTVSNAFEKVGSVTEALGPGVAENKITSDSCGH